MASQPHTVNYLSHLAFAEFIAHAPHFTIIPRDASGKPGRQYPLGDPPHVISGINICRYMLTHPKVREAFETVALRFSNARPNSWYLQGPSPMTIEQVTNIFLRKIFATFPVVFVDYGLQNPDQKGFHTRRPWDGEFEPSHQAISINGQRADHMSAAFLNADDEDGQHLFRAFLFMTIHTFLHEMGHLFVTFLTKGHHLTPTQVNALSMHVPGSNGEAGRALEHIIFGGTINYFHEPISGTAHDQCGTAYLGTPSGAYYRISRKTIDDTASSNFKFPYDHEKSPEQRERLIRLGEGLAPDAMTDPLEREEVAYLL